MVNKSIENWVTIGFWQRAKLAKGGRPFFFPNGILVGRPTRFHRFDFLGTLWGHFCF
jgi:hypothetical protein